MKKDKVLNGLDAILEAGDVRKPKRSPEGNTTLHLRWMIKEMKENKERFSDAKWNRWLGYIQGMMVAYSLTSLHTERNRNR